MPTYQSGGFGGAIDTSEVTDGAVTLAKLESGIQGDILYYAAAGVPTRLGAGTAGQILQTGGGAADPSWADTGACVLLGTTTLAAAGTSIDLSGLSTAVHKSLMVVFELKKETDTGAKGFYVAANADGGANYYYNNFECVSAVSAEGSAQTEILLGEISSTSRMATGHFIISNVATLIKSLSGTACMYGRLYVIGGDWNNTANNITQITLTCSENFGVGSWIKVYGLR